MAKDLRGQSSSPKFKSSLHKNIYASADKCVFGLKEEEVEFLRIDKDKEFEIKDKKFKLVDSPSGFYILFLVKGKKNSGFEFKDGDFYVGGIKKDLKVLKLGDFKKNRKKKVVREEEVDFMPPSEQIEVGGVDVSSDEVLSVESISADIKEIESGNLDGGGTSDDSGDDDGDIPELSIDILTKTTQKNLKDSVNRGKDLKEGFDDKGDLFDKIEAPKKAVSFIEEEKGESKETVKREFDGIKVFTDKETIFALPVELDKFSPFWFTLNADFRNTDEFWNDLVSYYKINTDKKIKFIGKDDIPPVFSRKLGRINIPLLHESFIKRISERIDELEKSKERLEGELSGLQADLDSRGIVHDNDPDFRELSNHNRELHELLENAKRDLSKNRDVLLEIEKNARGVLDRFFVDIHGSPQILSRFYEQVTNKLLELNLDINGVFKQHIELERVLIKNLKNIQAAQNIEEDVRIQQQQEILEAYKNKDEEYLEGLRARNRQDVLSRLGDIQETTATIRRYIDKERRKVQTYLDNLRTIDKYESFDVHVYNHKKKRVKFQRDADELNRTFYKLKKLLVERERKFDGFFESIDREVFEFRREVNKTFSDNDALIDSCMKQLWGRWNSEAMPVINGLFGRYEKIISSFSTIPYAQIVKTYQFQRRLLKEALDRQNEWEKIFNEIQKEFKDMGYELDTPMPSELDNKYIEQLETSALKLSPSTQKTLFIPVENFKLADCKDTLIGLDPKIMDDDTFMVIDQVWTTLTEEQERLLREKLELDTLNKKRTIARQTKEFLKTDQLKNISKSFATKMASLDKNTKMFTPYERSEKMREIEDKELKLWKSDNYLIANSKGEFKDVLYQITKKLFKNKSVRMVNSEIVLTDDGFVEDGNTEIYTAKDYFIKPESGMFKNNGDEIDIGGSESMHNEPNENTLEEISDPEFVGRIGEKYSPKTPQKPSISELAQISLKKFREQRKTYEIDVLKEKLLLLADEVQKLKKYHDEKTAQLEGIIDDRSKIFEEMQRELQDTKGFLRDKEDELERIFSEAEKTLEISLEEIDKSLNVGDDSLIKHKSPFVRWMSKLLFGEREE